MGTTRSTAAKLLASASLVGTAAAVAGLGTFGTFTSTTTASADQSSGTVVIALGNTGASTNRLTVNATGLVPGDTVQRSVDLANTGSEDLASVTLTTSANPSSLLAKGLVSKNDLIKVLGRGELTKKLTVRAHAFSKSAEAAITAAGGTVEVLPKPWGDAPRPPAKGNQHTNR